MPSIYVFSYFPFGFESRMWDLIISVPDHCLSFYFVQFKIANRTIPYFTVAYYATVICNHGPYGAGDSTDIAGLKCHALSSISSPQCRGNRPLKFHNYLPGAEQGFWQEVDHKNVSAVPAMHREKSKSPLFPSPLGAVVTNEWCITHSGDVGDVCSTTRYWFRVL